MTYTYFAGDELPGWEPAISTNGVARDYSAGYTFECKVVDAANAVVLTKTTGIVGGVGTVTVQWSAGELALATGSYTRQLRVIRTVDSYDLTIQSPMRIKARF